MSRQRSQWRPSRASALRYFPLHFHCQLLSVHLIVTVLHMFNCVSLQLVRETSQERRGETEMEQKNETVDVRTDSVNSSLQKTMLKTLSHV